MVNDVDSSSEEVMSKPESRKKRRSSYDDWEEYQRRHEYEETEWT
jgi:hypothetical protein